ncbi:hypothetical protein AB0L35_13820 [Streptomyces sp. NPDC052309]|uniref:Transferase n=1 Tax=Streptomyces griseicoloratus TaxID=2752516 RepID=A0A926QPG3_9ACTN|nr:hypothetical protein [Streptomyces griseicoloratus]MBD0419709.1 hypothetical protein [Streptomyces griseicoloratus]
MTSPAPLAAPLRADCIADSAGGLTFDVAAYGDTAAAHLVLRRRDGDDEVSLPLAPAAEGRLRAALPSSVALPEGRWDAYARVADGAPRRLAPGVTDLRSLADRTPGGLLGHVAVRIPYATRQGNLTVRSWLRAPHAEAGDLGLTDSGVTVQGRLYGTELAPGAHAELRCRTGGHRARRLDVTAERADEFRLTVAYGALAPGTWDLWLRPAGARGPAVRVARLLDDIADKNPVLTYPRARVETPHGPVEAGPYYTRDNDLSVSVTASRP